MWSLLATSAAPTSVLARLMMLAISALLACGPAQAQSAEASAAPASAAATLTARPDGDRARGRQLLLQRQVSGCILCHRVPGMPAGGALGPPLEELASRYSAATLRERIADARRFNPETIMPPYLSTEGLHNVARGQQGATVLDEQAVADIVAYLLAPGSPRDERR